MTTTTTPSVFDGVLAAAAEELERAHIPGMEVAVVRDGAVLFAGGIGVRGIDDPEPVGDRTLFNHGSCGKAYTGLLAALLAADGVIDLDVAVRRYVPELVLPDPVVAERVTIRDLLSHRSGLGRADFAWIFNPSWSLEDVVARLEHLPLVGDLRAQWSYSNFGFALAGLAMTRASGLPWSQLLQQRVLDVLGMTRTLATSHGLAADPDHATPHIVRDGHARPTVYRPSHAIAPAGEVVSCAEDATRWLLAHLGAGPISAEVLAAAHAPQMLVPAGTSPFPELELTGYAFGWVVGRFRGRALVWHNGGVDGFATQTLLLPHEGIGAVVCANVFPSNVPFGVVLDIADALLGVDEPPSWQAKLRAPEMSEQAPPPPDRAAEPTNPPARALPAYAGTYEHGGYGRLVVSVDRDVLHVRLGDYDVATSHRHFETWDLRYEPLDADGTVTFTPGADGEIKTADVALATTGETVSFVRQSAA